MVESQKLKMTDYNQQGGIGTDLSSYFRRTIVFEANRQAVVVIQCPLGDVSHIIFHSAEFFFDEKLCEFRLWYEIEEKEFTEFKPRVAIIEKLYLQHRLGKTLFKLFEKKGRYWLYIHFHLSLPSPVVREPSLDTWYMQGCFRDFWTDMRGYIPYIIGRSEVIKYESKWILEPKKGGYDFLEGRMRVGDKLNCNFGNDEEED